MMTNTRLLVSRNKREGRYAGKYAAPYIVKHWRCDNLVGSLKGWRTYNKTLARQRNFLLTSVTA